MTPPKKKPRPKRCVWIIKPVFKYMFNYWYASCGGAFTPPDAWWKFVPFAKCPYCGKKIEVKK